MWVKSNIELCVQYTSNQRDGERFTVVNMQKDKNQDISDFYLIKLINQNDIAQCNITFKSIHFEFNTNLLN